MRKLIRSTITDRVIFFLIIILTFLQLFSYKSSEYRDNNNSLLENEKKELFRQYINTKGPITTIAINDSLTGIFEHYKTIANAGAESGMSLAKMSVLHNNESPKRYYIGLGNFYLKYDVFEFSGDSVFFMKKGGKWLHANYSFENYEMLFPIKWGTYKVLRLVLNIVLIITLILFLVNVFSLPLDILSNISKGKIFTEKNMLNIGFIARTTIIWTTFIMSANIILVAIYYPRVKDCFYFSWFDMFKSYSIVYVFGLAALLLSRAFKRGYQLQQENELTV